MKLILKITFFFKFDRQRADGGPLAVSIARMPPAGHFSSADWDTLLFDLFDSVRPSHQTFSDGGKDLTGLNQY